MLPLKSTIGDYECLSQYYEYRYVVKLWKTDVDVNCACNVSICISSLLVWITINTFKTCHQCCKDAVIENDDNEGLLHAD